MSLWDKVKIHIEDIAWSGSFRFAFYCILDIIRRRRIPLPNVILKNYCTNFGSEEYLEKYMVPRHNGFFIDIGANIGLWALPLAKQGVEVHAFEPSPRPYKVLRKAAKKYPNLHVYPYALGEANYLAQLNLHYSSGHNSLARTAKDFTGHQIKTRVRSLDGFNMENVGLIKIDTQGYEIPILLGAKQTIIRCKPRLIIEIHSPYEEQIEKATQILKELGYHWKIGHKVSLSGIRGPQPHVIADPND